MKTEVNICGVKLKNPIILASGTAGFGREFSEYYDLSMLGGICTKGLTLEKRLGNDTPRIAETASGMLNAVGLQNPGVDHFIEKELPFMRSLNTVIIVNIAGNTVEDYIKMAQRLDIDGVDMVEMNISCPNVKAGGIAFGIYPDAIEGIVREVRRATKKPLIVKLSPNVADIAENARAAECAGADAVSLINTLTGMAIDYKTRKPRLANIVGGLSGAAIKPVALRMVYNVYKAVKIPVIGLGGIARAEDILEFMLAGASAVQVGTAAMCDPLAPKKMAECLTKLGKECRIKKLSDLTGALIT